MKKTPYVELPKGAIINIFDEDEGNMDIIVEHWMEFDKNKRVKEEALSIAEPNAKLELEIMKGLVAVVRDNARKMSII